MKIEYNKLSHFFFYLTNISAYDIHRRDEYVKYWIKKTGSLTNIESKSLDKVKKIFLKYSQYGSKKYIGRCFIDREENEILTSIKSFVNKKEYTEIVRTLDIFSQRFETLWIEDEKRLRNIKKELERLSNDQYFQDVCNKFSIVFGQIPNNYLIRLFVVPVESQNIGGEANTGFGIVSIEIRDTRDIKNGLFVSLHELAHMILRKEKGIRFIGLNIKQKNALLDIEIIKNMGVKDGLEEILLRTLIPDGYLSYDSKDTLDKTPNLNPFEKRLNLEMYDIAKKYFETNQKIDQDYLHIMIEKIIQIN